MDGPRGVATLIESLDHVGLEGQAKSYHGKDQLNVNFSVQLMHLFLGRGDGMKKTQIKRIMGIAHHNAVIRDCYGKDPAGAIIDKIREELKEFEVAIACGEKPLLEVYNKCEKVGADKKLAFEAHIKNTDADELADIIITALAGAEELGIDIERHIELKMEYNRVR